MMHLKTFAAMNRAPIAPASRRQAATLQARRSRPGFPMPPEKTVVSPTRRRPVQICSIPSCASRRAASRYAGAAANREGCGPPACDPRPLRTVDALLPAPSKMLHILRAYQAETSNKPHRRRRAGRGFPAAKRHVPRSCDQRIACATHTPVDRDILSSDRIARAQVIFCAYGSVSQADVDFASDASHRFSSACGPRHHFLCCRNFRNARDTIAWPVHDRDEPPRSGDGMRPSSVSCVAAVLISVRNLN